MSAIVPGFRARNEEMRARIASRPESSHKFRAEMRARMEQEDREYKMGLAAIREAGHQTQTELARKLGKPQANVSRTERAGDMLYSTLLAYLEAAGATDVALVATVGGHRVEVALAST